MKRPPIAIALAVFSAILMLVGLINRGLGWGIWVLVAGVAVLVVAGVIAVRANL